MDNECSAPTPRCAPDLTCVECVEAADCTTSEPTCDASTHECRACALDSDCTSEICNAADGTCVPEASIAYSIPSGSSAAACTRTEPCAIERAFATTGPARHYVKLRPGVYTANIAVSGKLVDVRGAGATVTSSGNTLTVNDSGVLRVSGAVVVSSNAGGTAVVCKSLNFVDRPQLLLEDVTIESAGFGALLSQCSATLARTAISANGGISALNALIGTTAEITQSSIRGNGTSGGFILTTDNSLVRLTNSLVVGTATSQGAEIVAAGGCIVLAFSTVINTKVTSTQSPAICGGATANGVCMENSIVANFLPAAPASTVIGAGSIAGYSIAFPQAAAIAGPGNKNANPQLVDVANGDYHLKLGSPAIDAADPASTQMIDYGGKARPQGAARDMGAFEYP